MPKSKDLKRLTRSRMQKTGEPYTTARARLIEKRHRTSRDLDFAGLAGMSDEAVHAKTGRKWREWVVVLDEKGAASMPHRDIAKYVHDAFDVPGWWAQTITVGYERIRGLREVGQRRGGAYEANKSKTLPVPLERLYRAFSVARTRNRWLPGIDLRVRKATPGKSMRITWEDRTLVQAYFTAKGPNRSQVAIQHGGLATKSHADRMKEFWGERLAALTTMLKA